LFQNKCKRSGERFARANRIGEKLGGERGVFSDLNVFSEQGKLFVLLPSTGGRKKKRGRQIGDPVVLYSNGSKKNKKKAGGGLTGKVKMGREKRKPREKTRKERENSGRVKDR